MEYHPINSLDHDPLESTRMSRRQFLIDIGITSGALIIASSLPPSNLAQAESIAISSSNDIVLLDAVDLSTAIRTKKVSCREVMEAYLKHIDRLNPKVNAIVSLQGRENLLRQADERDRQLASGQYMGWMHGFPQAIKDLGATAGILTTFGSPIFKDNIPKVDAIFVDRVKKNGAIIIGKTNVPEFGRGSHTFNSIFGTTLNAYDQKRSAGGSSGGAAVAVALRMLPVADGSDRMGSLRNPSGWNNIYSLRPSWGRVPSSPGGDVYYEQLAVWGPLARTVKDMAMLLSVQAGYSEWAPLGIAQDPVIFTQSLKRDFKGTKVAFLGNLGGYLPMEAGVLDLCRKALKDFETIGCVVEEAVPNFNLDRLWQVWLTLTQLQMAANYGYLSAEPAKWKMLKPEVAWEIENGLKLTAANISKAMAERSDWYRAMLTLFRKFDYPMLPSAQVFPFDAKMDWPKEVAGKPMDTFHRWMQVSIYAALLGVPTGTFPVGFNEAGLPMGIQVMGKAQSDLSVLQLVYAYEQATGWVQKRKPSLLQS
jgi:amidase